MIETEKTTIEPKLYNVTSITTTIWNTQSTTGKTTSPLKIEQNITQNPISTTTSSKDIKTGNIDCTYGLSRMNMYLVLECLTKKCHFCFYRTHYRPLN